jgi:hypothetical protein
VLVVGDTSGYVHPYEITMAKTDKRKVTIDALNEGGKVILLVMYREGNILTLLNTCQDQP